MFIVGPGPYTSTGRRTGVSRQVLREGLGERQQARTMKKEERRSTRQGNGRSTARVMHACSCTSASSGGRHREYHVKTCQKTWSVSLGARCSVRTEQAMLVFLLASRNMLWNYSLTKHSEPTCSYSDLRNFVDVVLTIPHSAKMHAPSTVRRRSTPQQMHSLQAVDTAQTSNPTALKRRTLWILELLLHLEMHVVGSFCHILAI